MQQENNNGNNGGWNRWSKYVIKEIARINDVQKSFRDALDDFVKRSLTLKIFLYTLSIIVIIFGSLFGYIHLLNNEIYCIRTGVAIIEHRINRLSERQLKISDKIDNIKKNNTKEIIEHNIENETNTLFK